MFCSERVLFEFNTDDVLGLRTMHQDVLFRSEVLDVVAVVSGYDGTYQTSRIY